MLNVNAVLFPITFVAFQTHAVGVLVEVSVNWTVNGAEPEVGVPTKLATGNVMVMVVPEVLVAAEEKVGGASVNVNPLVIELMTPVLLTNTLTAPVAWLGVIAVIVVAV